MLRRTLFLGLLLASVLPMQAWSQTTDQNKPRVQVTDASIQAGQSVTWTASNVYVLNGFVYVESGATLTIEPGTVVKARTGTGAQASALVVARGAKIFANGTRQQPIVFTSVRDSVAIPDYGFDNGDGVDYREDRSLWGGVVILGSATNNVGTDVLVEGLPDDPRARHGGTNDQDDSGVFRYVQIKYSGSVIEANRELQGLTLGSVGAGTTVEYVESFNSGDDGFEFFGGTVNTKYLIAAFADDDAFDYDQGFRGKHQFWFAIQAPNAGDKLGEYDSGDAPTVTATPLAMPVIYNATYLGRGTGHTRDALIYKEYGGGEHWNTIFGEYGSGVAVAVDSAAGETAYSRFVRGEIVLKNNIFFGATGALSNRAAVRAYLQNNGNRTVNPALVGIARLHTAAAKLDPRPAAGSAALTGAATPPADGFFTPVDYVGAFGPNANWAADWTALYANDILRDGTQTGIEDADVSLPDATTLLSYPNPVRGEAAIVFALDAPQHVRLAVYDLMGREVAVLADEYASAGTKTVRFDAAGLASGTYVYRLATERGVESRTLTVVQ